MTDVRPLVCAKCRVAVKVIQDSEPEATVICPQCGERERFENIKQMLEQQMQEWRQRKLAESPDGKNGPTYKEGPSTKRNYRFVIRF